MMNTVVLKFGGSSVADNIKLNVVAQKIIEFKEKFENVVVVVSAQGKTTDNLIKEAQELSAIPDEREMDMLLSTGEQITAAKLSILLNRKGYKTVSLTGWQAGIQTNKVYKNSKIEAIYPERIKKELEKRKIVVVAGFQGINEDYNITTLGRGGSDTTAVAIEAALDADKCYIFSDVDGIYSTDPNITEVAKKLDEISFKEMLEIADAGAKVLHNRCIRIGQKFDCDIIAASTFSDEKGTKIRKRIENTDVKSIVKNENLTKVCMEKEGGVSKEDAYEIYYELLNKNIIVESFKVNGNIKFRINETEQNKVAELIETKNKDYTAKYQNITKLTVVGYGIIQDNKTLKKIIKSLRNNNIEIQDINLDQSKIEVLTDTVPDEVVDEIHKELIK